MRTRSQVFQRVPPEPIPRIVSLFLADDRDEVDSKPTHGRPACAAPRIVSEFIVCATRQVSASDSRAVYWNGFTSDPVEAVSFPKEP